VNPFTLSAVTAFILFAISLVPLSENHGQKKSGPLANMKRAVLLILALCFLTSITKPGFSEKPLRLFFEKNIPVDSESSQDHVVKQGEWLFKILEAKGYSPSQIQQALPGIEALNPHIPDINRLMPGQVLQIPEFSSAVSLGIKRPKPAVPPDSYEKMPYVVRPGDTLIQILQRQGVPTKLIFSQYMDLFLNLNPDVPDSNTLRVGQAIVLPVLAQDEKAPAAPVAPPTPAAPKIVAVTPGPPAPIPAATGTGGAARTGARQPDTSVLPPVQPPRPEPAEVAPKAAPAPAVENIGKDQSSQTNSTQEAKKDERTPRTGLPLVKTVLEQMRFRFMPGDESMYPLAGTQWLIVKMQETPLLDAPWGGKIIFCPVPKNAQWIENANKLGMRICAISPRWNLQEVLQKLSTSFPKNFHLWAAGKDLVLSSNGVGITLQSPQLVIMEHGGKKRIHMVWTRLTPDSPALPQGLHEVLDSAQVKVIELDAYNELSRLPSRPRDSIYVPVATHMELIRAMNPDNPEEIFGKTMPDSLNGLLQVLRDKELLHQGMVQASWSSGAQNRIAIQVPAWTVSGGNGRIAILDGRFSDPFLVSVLSHEGYSCFVLPD
jgi:LysM repeat protein